MLNRRAALAALIVFALGGLAASADAATPAPDTQWQKTHPRREQVNSRLNRQNQRIDQELKQGQITKQQAQKMHAQDRQIHQEETTMARENGNTHITPAEKKSLNQQENAVSQQIGR